jgi:hypothetical protein
MGKNSESVIRTQRRKKEIAVERMGGKCQLCGYDRCINALEFHHVDPTTKAGSPSYLVMRAKWETVEKELEKCILICANCHREIHYKVLNVDLQALVRPWNHVVCPSCKKEFTTKLEHQTFCSNKCRAYHDRRTTRPSKEELAQLIQENSWVALGKIFGVSDNAIRKWARGYGIL